MLRCVDEALNLKHDDVRQGWILKANATLQKPEQRFKVRLAIFNGPYQDKLVKNYAVNVSTGGVFMETSNILPVDTLLVVEFMLPNKVTPITCRARVAWTNEPHCPKNASLPPGVGLQFLNLSLDDIQVIRDFLEFGELSPTW